MFAFLTLGISLSTVAAQATPMHWDKVVQIAQDKKLSESLHWRRLGYYRCSFGSCESEQDGSYFFLSPQGKTNPEAELIATIEAFKNPHIRQFGESFPEQSTICQFPARLTWLARETGEWDANELLKSCKEFQEFKQRLDAGSASLVFSSFYLNNPSSAFGHTLLKINRRQKLGPQADLLNYGVGYAANPTTNNPVLYALMGLLGGFGGTYTALPYYYKVREYNDFENRDLWEYDLALTDSEIDMLVKHLWELGFAEFRYFYLSENCSYQLMNLLDIAALRLDLADPLPYWVLPIDTIKAVNDVPGLVTAIHHRSSLANSLERRFSILNKEERQQFFTAIQDYSPHHPMSVNVLDAVIDHFDMHQGAKLVAKDPEATQKKHMLLVQRANINEPSAPLPPDSASSPHLAHGSFRWEFGSGRRERSPGLYSEAYHFGVRFALHDLNDPIIGLPPYARLEMFHWQFFYDTHKDRLRMDRFRFVGIEALNSWTALWQRPAWRLDLGHERIQDRRCNDCLTGLAGGSIGLSKNFSVLRNTQLAPFIYANARVRTGKFINADLSVEAGPSAGIRLTTKHDFSVTAEIENRTIWNRFRDHDVVTSAIVQKTFNRDWALRFQYDNSEHAEQMRTSILFFE